ncbi:MAG: insulinase family protein, partial [Candidatus Aminicenantes bacterium]
MAIVGDFNHQELKDKVSHIFGQLKKTALAAPIFEKASLLEKSIEIKKEMDVNQAYLIIGLSGPDYNHPDHSVAGVLIEILGH